MGRACVGERREGRKGGENGSLGAGGGRRVREEPRGRRLSDAECKNYGDRKFMEVRPHFSLKGYLSLLGEELSEPKERVLRLDCVMFRPTADSEHIAVPGSRS